MSRSCLDCAGDASCCPRPGGWHRRRCERATARSSSGGTGYRPGARTGPCRAQYCSPQRHDEVLTDHLPQLLTCLPETVDRWFFLRYRDPHPHLRLRLHGPARELQDEVLARLRAWTERVRGLGLVQRLALDTYRPEWERYGGPPAMAADERVFHADSLAVLTQLKLQRSGKLPVEPLLMAAAGVVDLSSRFCAQAATAGITNAALLGNWEDWILRTFAKDEHHVAFQHRRGQAQHLITPPDWAQLRTYPGSSTLFGMWQQRAVAVRDYVHALADPEARRWSDPSTVLQSVLHMHHNRFLGTDRNTERDSYAIARGIVQAEVDRRRNAR
ncbi:thiopeptide-type bacteriocin biosynthesis protein [Saccharopolyspora erythraea]|uniref:thiopeptide-type bacteriocin biosynthesis protein n=1 Tax=Saccharopolyspora erythraea TaxID=1836 RepID=UPI003624AEB8